MTAGYSGSYGINGTNLSLSPTQGAWEDKSIVGFDGEGRPIYSALTSFTLSWGLMSTSDFKQLSDFYLYVSNTGTVISDLPKWGDVDYLFESYTGTIVQRPTAGAYFSEHVEDVKLVISHIRVP